MKDFKLHPFLQRSRKAGARVRKLSRILEVEPQTIVIHFKTEKNPFSEHLYPKCEET